MSKQHKDEQTVVPRKSDKEKISVIVPKQYWAPESPYIDAYIRALNGAEYNRPADDYTLRVDGGESAAVAETGKSADGKTKKGKIKKHYKKRSFALVLFAIVMLASIVVAGLGIVGPIGDYVSPYLRMNSAYDADVEGSVQYHSVSFFDPIYSLIKMLTTEDAAVDEPSAAAAETTTETAESTDEVINFSTYYLDDCLKDVKGFEFEGAETEAIVRVIVFYAFPVIIILFLIGCLYMFIKAIVAAASKKKKKFKFGFAWIVTFIMLLGTVVIGMVWNNNGVGELKNYFMYPIGALFNIESLATPPSNLSMGFGLWIELILMVIGFILMCCSYKKLKKPLKSAPPAAAAKR